MDRTRLVEACQALPLFPLPGTVLMPGSLLPLHVFEPRYRQLVSDCLRDHVPLSVPQLRPDEETDSTGRPAFYPYASVGLIGAHQELADGRFNVLVQPLARIRIVEERSTTRLYRIARAIVLVDEHVPRDELATVGERVRGVFAPLVGRMGQVGEGVARALRSLPAERVSEAVASVVLRADDLRQAFLSENNPVRRAMMVETSVLTLLAEVGGTQTAEA
ncbi:MAG: LON peptidase substrate-binding domain-containing protein [Myxococcota bacterium]